MNIYISGKNGFIGSNLVKLFPSESIIPYDIDLEYIHMIKLFKPDIIIHCAARVGTRNCQKNYLDTYKSNIIGTMKISEVAKELCSYFVYVSSIDVYKFSSTDEVCELTEDSLVDPYTIYGRTKYEGELISKEIVGNVLILRLGYIFGNPKEDKYSLISNVLTGNEVSLVGEYNKDYLYIDDCVSAIKCLVDERVLGIVNIGSGEMYSIKTILNTLGVNNFVFDKNDYTRNFVINTDILKNKYGWQPKTNFWDKLYELKESNL